MRSYDLDILKYNTLELIQIASAIMQDAASLATFNITLPTLGQFLKEVSKNYHDHPYHNFTHGVHVLQATLINPNQP